ncbi:mannose-6-phosphate isomerase [Flavobacterium sp. NST-5]|uniref:Phosphohexomutase n=1 Tax=Flavobacterium ichthyis TaxID=2698827 RepID=A0ABW9Z9N7_9FLAO|nr:type I phosphomannose isomerase catalytic subunit [Flavobacterium ichthyis]NBL64871.1 mannose-6-phosphate isomerase [Flavobacterium ichthyis]
MSEVFYPLTFTPILKDRIWGGKKLQTDFNKNIESPTTGESWEISGVENSVSEVMNGQFQGKSFNWLLKEFPKEILGNRIFEKFGTTFPLLFKFIDAREDLSIQVHPNDELAKKRHNSFGKTEMWYVMQADENARIVVGFKKNSDQQEYLQALKNKNLLSILKEVPVKKGDVFFLETGTVHAIGAGIVIAEIQQTSDITYRIYDWDRVDAQGNSRELHTEEALDAINYNSTDAQKQYAKTVNEANQLVHCEYFITNYLPIDKTIEVNITNDCFRVYMCMEGIFEIVTGNETYSYKKGDTVLIPAALSQFKLSGKATLLEIYI